MLYALLQNYHYVLPYCELTINIWWKHELAHFRKRNDQPSSSDAEISKVEVSLVSRPLKISKTMKKIMKIPILRDLDTSEISILEISASDQLGWSFLFLKWPYFCFHHV